MIEDSAKAAPPPLLVTRDGPIVTLTLNHPERRNPVSDNRLIDALIAALSEAERDLGVGCAILTGAGSAFSAGGDLAAMREGRGLRADLPAQTRRNYREGIQRLPLFFHALELPVIAAVNGPAIGAGCDLALMCDIRIAGESARFAESFVKLGIVPGDGGAWLLTRTIGIARASELALTGDMIDAREAERLGLVSRVVADDRLIGEAQTIAKKVAANPPHAVRMTKRLLRQAMDATLPAMIDMSGAMQALCHATRDNEEAMAAFLEKRPARFRGD